MECDHCFVWGSPHSSGTMSIERVRSILRQARDVPSIEWIYFEGGEPFLHYPLLVQAVTESHEAGFKVGIVTNAYWATSVADALLWLQPLAGRISDFSVSSDLFHSDQPSSPESENAAVAARRLGMPVGIISVRDDTLMYRGRAAEKLVHGRIHHPWGRFSTCPHENLAEPGRVHVDPFGNIHICQGIVVGNLFNAELKRICDEYDPATHPIAGPIVREGPAGLVRHHRLPIDDEYVDACHLCYSARVALRERDSEFLVPDQMYGRFARRD